MMANNLDVVSKRENCISNVEVKEKFPLKFSFTGCNLLMLPSI